MELDENPFHTVTWSLSSTLRNLVLTAVRNSGSVSIEMEGCEDVRDVWFTVCAVIKFLSAEKNSPIDSHRCMQAMFGINVLMDIRYGSLSKKLGKQICVTKQGWESHWLQQDGIQKFFWRLEKVYWSWRWLCGKMVMQNCKWMLKVHLFFVSPKYLPSLLFV